MELTKPTLKEWIAAGAAGLIAAYVVFSIVSAHFSKKIEKYDGIYRAEHELAVQAMTKAQMMSVMIQQKDAEIERLKRAVPAAPPPAPAVKPDSTTEEVAAGLKLAGMYNPQPLPEGLKLSLPDGRLAWQWGLEAKRVPALEARSAGLEGVITAQGERITLTDTKVGHLETAIVHKDKEIEAIQVVSSAALKKAAAEERKGKVKLYGGIAIGLGAGWLIFK